MKLTQASIDRASLPDGLTDKIFFDDDLPGFGLRIREGGSRKFIVHYRRGGIQHRHTLGVAGVLSLSEARKKARKVLVAVDDGKDPAAEKANTRAAASLIFSAVVVDYLAAMQPRMKPRSYAGSAMHLNNHWKPLHGLAIGSVTRATVASRLRELAVVRKAGKHMVGGPVAADRARATLSAFYAWAIGEGLCDVNPVVGTNKLSEGKSRERVLSDPELAAIWNAAPASDYGRIVKLLMLTAQRRDEIGSLQWPEIDTQAKLIALPGERTKNNRPHDVPLSAPALAVLKDTPARDDRELVFGEGEGGYSGWSRSKEALDKASKVKGWTLHDLRRTAATRMADLGVQPHIVEAVINHVSGHKGGVAGIYNRATYAAEKRAALDLWASHVLVAAAQADGGNVTRLRKVK